MLCCFPGEDAWFCCTVGFCCISRRCKRTTAIPTIQHWNFPTTAFVPSVTKTIAATAFTTIVTSTSTYPTKSFSNASCIAVAITSTAVTFSTSFTATANFATSSFSNITDNFTTTAFTTIVTSTSTPTCVVSATTTEKSTTFATTSSTTACTSQH